MAAGSSTTLLWFGFSRCLLFGLILVSLGLTLWQYSELVTYNSEAERATPTAALHAAPLVENPPTLDELISHGVSMRPDELQQEQVGWAGAVAGSGWELEFSKAWPELWKQEETLELCPSMIDKREELLETRSTPAQPELRCLLTSVKFELDPDEPRPLYQRGPDGKLHPTEPEDPSRREPYVCLTRQLAVDYRRVAADATSFDYRGYGMSTSELSQGALHLGGCPHLEEAAMRWHPSLQARCRSAQILRRTSIFFTSLTVNESGPSDCIQDNRLTVFVTRPAISNWWEAHFALVEAAMRLAALGLLPTAQRAPPSESEATAGQDGVGDAQVIFMPPDPANEEGSSAPPSTALWGILLGGRALAAKEVEPMERVCYKRAVILADFCCDAHDLCPPSRLLPELHPEASSQKGSGRRGSTDGSGSKYDFLLTRLRRLPCVRHGSLAGCAYGLARYRFHAALVRPVPGQLDLQTTKKKPSGVKVLLVSRRSARDRRFVDEDHLISAMPSRVLQHLTVIALDFATMAVAEQVRAVAQSDLLAAIHGAGLTNMLFLLAQGGVAEIALSEGWADLSGMKGSPLMYEDMAERLGLSYARWLYNGTLDAQGTIDMDPSVLSALLMRVARLMHQGRPEALPTI